MKITRLVAENFKRLTAVSISPDGSTVVIGGRNGQGKSSALDAIEAALGGAKHAPEEPIKKGAKGARIVVETDELVVTRKFPAKGSSQIEVRAKDGSVYASPQALLDGLVGPISFDPLLFTRLPAKEQAATLRALVGLDFAKEDARRQEAYDRRTEVGRELRRLQGALDKLPEAPAGTPDAEVSVAELAVELQRRQDVNASNDAKRRALAEKRQQALGLAGEIEALRARLVELEAKLETMSAEGKALRAEVDGLTDADLAEVRQRIAGAEQTNRAVRAKLERAKLEAESDAATDQSEKLTEYIQQIDAVKADAAAKARYPIEGLAITDEGLTLKGVPFAQASSAEQLRASVAIGLALNPKLKLLLVRDGSLLDRDSLELVAKMATDAGAQVWLERVSTGDECSVIIEDGEVSETRPSQEAAAAS